MTFFSLRQTRSRGNMNRVWDVWRFSGFYAGRHASKARANPGIKDCSV